ncbi:hypothetical protein ACFYMO_29010 [Streptomyces sp. NPDC007025]|uniref:hypothetical protein n=1 Tax=Streptomyces sp. NPDC007025 TaxID=3364771 RepID=UPI0036C5EA51
MHRGAAGERAVPRHAHEQFGVLDRSIRGPGRRHRRLSAADAGPVDMAMDLLPPAAPAAATRAAALTVREYGRVVLMGGVGMLGGADLALPYPWLMRNSVTARGQWMYPRSTLPGLIRILASGTLDLGAERLRTLSLDAVDDAVPYAAAHVGPFDRTVLTPAAG